MIKRSKKLPLKQKKQSTPVTTKHFYRITKIWN